MDLKQRKLNKSEWESIEVPVSSSENDVLKMIIAGFHDVNTRTNNHLSLISFLKIELTSKMEDYLYTKYFKPKVDKVEADTRIMIPEYKTTQVDSNIQIKGADKIRLERNDDANIQTQNIYEHILLNHIEKIVYYKKKGDKKQMSFHYFTLYKLIRNTISNVNRHIIELSKKMLESLESEIDISLVINNAVEFIERNESLLKYSDMELYSHQKEIFTICKNPNPKLILYMAPTGTGKTLTPIGLSESHRVIFVCAARHVGVALAKSAISVNKKVAFAFGCGSAADIRLHYFAAKEYTKHRKSGGIGKVDNSIGDDVEIMICDIKSYLPAMFYMKSFNQDEKLIVYWDEPTITMDYENHEFHEIIKQNWSENLIPNMVLSSATLPKLNELDTTIPDFKNKFPGAEIHNIISHDCKKSIPIVNKDGFVVLPHYLSENYDEIKQTIAHCENNLTLLRYFDLNEIVKFVSYVHEQKLSKIRLERYFEDLNCVNMTTIKLYYLNMLKSFDNEKWSVIYRHFAGNRSAKILTRDKPGTTGVLVTTKDAYSLTDGPTIFITDEIEKIAKFCIQQAAIPPIVMEDLMKKIEYNNTLNEKLNELERELDFVKEQAEQSMQNGVSGQGGGVSVQGRSKSTKDFKKLNRDTNGSGGGSSKSEINKLTQQINSIRSILKPATLNDTFVPNKHHHLQKWAECMNSKASFTSDIPDEIVNEIMLLNGIEDNWKILLMMGIGVFINHENITYTEIMKKMADEQKLYMIIASSDYIYGTNYQFCHGYLSKDLNLTQEKLIQAMGRVGRNNIQQDYTLRFRDDSQIVKLFTHNADKPEIRNMNKLFSCD
jgi:hypothetical protein